MTYETLGPINEGSNSEVGGTINMSPDSPQAIIEREETRQQWLVEVAGHIANAKEWRQELADRLRTLRARDRTRATEILELVKADPTYKRAESYKQIQERQRIEEIKLSSIVEEAASIHDLIRLLKTSSIFIKNQFYGLDHSEHLIKSIEMAQATNSLSIVTEKGGLREKVETLMESSGRKPREVMDKEEYKDFLRAKFQHLNLSNYEIERIVPKLPPDLFVTIDLELEDIVILANSLKNVRTDFSCAGHIDGFKRSLDLDMNAYISITTPRLDIRNKIFAMQHEESAFAITTTELTSADNDLGRMLSALTIKPPSDNIDAKNWGEYFQSDQVKQIRQNYFDSWRRLLQSERH